MSTPTTGPIIELRPSDMGLQVWIVAPDGAEDGWWEADELVRAIEIAMNRYGCREVILRRMEATAECPICGQDTREAESRVTAQCALPAGHAGLCSAEEG